MLDVGGMKCGGCSAAVKRMLSQQEYVLSSGVNLVTSSAAVGVPAGDGAEALAQRAADALTSRVRAHVHYVVLCFRGRC